nr:MAG TPA: hypothetical protein [Caudoviricetes sp.]DAX83549.1 MAG TPA: hypothetical protein [Caudoviricetes sp.]
MILFVVWNILLLMSVAVKLLRRDYDGIFINKANIRKMGYYS